jgi:hypothetical protein
VTRYLKTEPTPHVEKVLVSDIRDVVFFGDPFADFQPELTWNVTAPQVFFVMEKHGVTMAYHDNPINSKWLTDCYPEGTQYDDQPVSCSGTVMALHLAFVNMWHKCVTKLKPILIARVRQPFHTNFHAQLLRVSKYSLKHPLLR